MASELYVRTWLCNVAISACNSAICSALAAAAAACWELTCLSGPPFAPTLVALAGLGPADLTAAGLGPGRLPKALLGGLLTVCTHVKGCV